MGEPHAATCRHDHMTNLPFSQSEYQRRLALTRSAMQQLQLDVLLVTDPSNMAWLTGYDGWSFYVHQGVLVQHHQPPLWWGRGIDAKGALRTVYMSAEHIHGYSDDYVMATTCHPMQHLAELLRQLGHARSAIGVEMENYYYSAMAHTCLNDELPNARLLDATSLVNWQRGVKSDQELAYMRHAATLSQAMIRKGLEVIQPGLRKNHLVAEIYRQAIAGEGDVWGDYPAIVPLIPSGADASAPHLAWNGDTIRPNEGTFFEISGCYRRYHSPLCRTVFLGDPPMAMRNAEAALIDGLAAGIDQARSGKPACAVANALYSTLGTYGLQKDGRCGYPVGLSYPPDWGERTISLRPDDRTELQPGMTFHFMPGLWMDDWGIEITETILITQSGPAECLSSFERKLFVR